MIKKITIFFSSIFLLLLLSGCMDAIEGIVDLLDEGEETGIEESDTESEESEEPDTASEDSSDVAMDENGDEETTEENGLSDILANVGVEVVSSQEELEHDLLLLFEAMFEHANNSWSSYLEELAYAVYIQTDVDVMHERFITAVTLQMESINGIQFSTEEVSFVRDQFYKSMESHYNAVREVEDQFGNISNQDEFLSRFEELTKDGNHEYSLGAHQLVKIGEATDNLFSDAEIRDFQREVELHLDEEKL
ncbi:hypothetical protein [Evansella tamaricis]|uniref:Lipoprotein n=1 Tax=Evansella tamaricis TaxID=2069301 RepID=A0ABS6J9W8_9BACI|nr:hypothetical protein [Evansella tamaricis]MBU9710313.1 hypothetical protein [Evansella tamaricis]